MSARTFILRMALCIVVYYVCVHVFRAEQLLGIGRNFVYAIF